MINNLICTVGTSLIEGNLRFLSEKTLNKPYNWQMIKQYYEEKNWRLLAGELKNVNPKERLCGAEINTISEIRERSEFELEKVFFLISETELGNNTGEIFKNFFEDIETEVITVQNLQDEKPKDFKSKGLTNLVKRIGEIVQRVGRNNIAIDATGGYKAQIAIGVLIGQALEIPVYYKHERFNEIINFPPLPVSLDYDILGEYADILSVFENGEVLTSEDLSDVKDKLKVLLNEVEIENEILYELNPIGQIYLMGFRLRNPKPVNLKEAGDKKRDASFRDDHYPRGFKEFVNKVNDENKWIVTCNSIPYFKQKQIKNKSFKVIEVDGDKKLIGMFRDNEFGARFEIHLTDISEKAKIWAADFLNQKYNN